MATKKQKLAGRILAALAFVLAVILPGPAVRAAALAGGNATTKTYTLRKESGNSLLIPTQDAYLTGDALFLDDPLRMPEDLYWIDSRLYVADTGNGRIVCQDLESGEIHTYGEGILVSPSGVFVTKEGEIYAADPSLGAVVVLDGQGRELRRYGRPESTAFGANTQYQPTKVAVLDSGIIYIVSSGSFDGIIQLDAEGEFMGYYGYNNIPMTALDVLQDLLFTEAQKQKLFNKIPLAFYNLALDEKGLCYTVTQRTGVTPLKKHNIAGVNILENTLPDALLADISIGPDGLIFAVSESGLIYELDNDGQLLFALGGQVANSERRGLFTLASGIAVDQSCNLYVLDKERGIVHTFLPTEYADLMHRAVRQYRNGEYSESSRTLERVLQLAGNIQIAYHYFGKVEMQLRDYEAATVNFRRAGENAGYSDAFWEVRTQRISKWFGGAVMGVLALALLTTFLARRRKKKEPEAVYFYTDGRRAQDRKFSENLKFSFRFFKAPSNSFYEVKLGARGTVGTGVCLYLLAFLAFALYYVGRGFAFTGVSLSNTSPLYLVILFFLPTGLFVLSSYMVSEVNSGEGSLKRMFIGMSYGLAPMICILPVLTFLTHILTRTESFLVNFGFIVAVLWTAVLELLAIKEIHNYEPGQVAVNVLLTLFLMIVILFAGSILVMFWDTALDTVSALFKEVCYRVLH